MEYRLATHFIICNVHDVSAIQTAHQNQQQISVFFRLNFFFAPTVIIYFVKFKFNWMLCSVLDLLQFWSLIFFSRFSLSLFSLHKVVPVFFRTVFFSRDAAAVLWVISNFIRLIERALVTDTTEYISIATWWWNTKSTHYHPITFVNELDKSLVWRMSMLLFFDYEDKWSADDYAARK